jgi:hypothetical protein
MPSWPTFRTWLQQFTGQDNELGALAAELDPRKPWDRGMWSVRKYEAYLKDAGAADEVLAAVPVAWERWQSGRPVPVEAPGEPGVSKHHPRAQRRRSGDVISVVIITGASARTQVVGRAEFMTRMAGSEAAERYGSGQSYAVLRPDEAAQWKLAGQTVPHTTKEANP